MYDAYFCADDLCKHACMFLLTFMMCTEYADVCRVGNFMYAHCTCTAFKLIFLNKAFLKEYFSFFLRTVYYFKYNHFGVLY